MAEAWRSLELPETVPAWHREPLPQQLPHSSCATPEDGRCLLSGHGSLRRAAEELCGQHLRPKALTKVEWRHLAFAAPPAELLRHQLPQMPAGCEPAPQPAQVVLPLRRDQLQLLALLLQREAEPATLEVKWLGRVDHVASRLQKGARVRLSPACPCSILAAQPTIQMPTCGDVQAAMQTAGLVVCGQERGVFEVEWRLELKFLRLRLDHRMLLPHRGDAVAVGELVHVRTPSEEVEVGHVGVVLRNLEGGLFDVSFPGNASWRGRPEELALSRAAGPVKTSLELRASASYACSGVLLAQPMGYGKTGVVLSLVASRPLRTLVLVPAHLHRQWLAETAKFLGCSAQGKGGWLCGRGGLKVWGPVSYADLRRTREAEALAANLVILSFGIFGSRPYRVAEQRRARDHEPWGFMPGEHEWPRLVIDEAHEMANLPKSDQLRVLALRRRSTHLLTATPGLEGCRGAAALALLMGISLCRMTQDDAVFRHEHCPEVREAARRFFATFATTGVVAAVSTVQEHRVPVHHSTHERLIYEDARDFRGLSQRELLELCCIFGEEASARNEIGQILAKKRQELAQAAARILCNVALLAVLAPPGGVRWEAPSPQGGRVDLWRLGAAEAQEQFEACAAAVAARDRRLLTTLLKSCTWSALRGARSRLLLLPEDVNVGIGLRTRIAALLDVEGTAELWRPVWEEQLALLGDDEWERFGACAKGVAFLERSLREDGACPICFDDIPSQEARMPPCGHRFHGDCLAEALRAHGQCPMCRQPCGLRDVCVVTAPRAPEDPSDPYLKYGTKLKVVVEALLELRRREPTAKVLVFLQFDRVRRKIAAAFRELGLPHDVLQGSAAQQGAIIERWQNDAAAARFALLLSLECSASGADLTAAHHVFFVHPMLSGTAEEAAGYERQAVGRVLRAGQRQPTVHVWRFVTEGTIEERLASGESLAWVDGTGAAAGKRRRL